jgi:hypothetical protein
MDEFRKREILRSSNNPVADYSELNYNPKMSDLIARFPPSQKGTCAGLWEKRTDVMHEDLPISEEDARNVVQTVSEFLDRHRRKAVLD